MKFVWLLAVLCIIALVIDHGESWGRRRRRRRGGRRRWFKKTVKKVGKFYKKHKKWIRPVGKVVWKAAKGWLGKKDSQTVANLATLKAYDRESYDEFLQNVWDTFEGEYPEEDLRELIERIDDVADMQPDEIELFKEDYDIANQGEGEEDELTRELADRVAALDKN